MSDELTFIAALRHIATHPAARGLADDCAVLEVGGETLILTHDMMAEGVHFLAGQDPADIAWKLVATNISDLAAKGAEPLGVLLGFTLGQAGADARFLVGLEAALAHYRAPLLLDGVAPSSDDGLGYRHERGSQDSPTPARQTPD